MRIWCKSAISVAALCAASGLIFGVPGAGATQGQAVLAGQQNAATYTTSIVNTNYVSLAD